MNSFVNTNAKKLAIYLPSLRGGGAERVMVTLANGFAARGFAVDLVLASKEGPYLKDVADNVRVVDLHARRVLTSLPGLVRYLRRERPSVMLSALNHANVIAVLARSLSAVRTRLVVSERNHFSASGYHGKRWIVRQMRRFMAWAYPHADGVVVVSKGVGDDLVQCIGLNESAISVVYNPIDVDVVAQRSREDVSHPWLQPGELPVVVAIGRLTPQKDFPTLLRAFARLRQTQCARLLILGEGELRPQLETLVAELGLQDHAGLPGFADNPFAYLSRSALFVLSSAWEGLPNVLIQAMACGTPVVSTACPSGPEEILEHGRWGRLVPVGDEVALAEAMAAALQQEAHPDVAARAAEFGVDRAVDGYLRVMLPGIGSETSRQ